MEMVFKNVRDLLSDICKFLDKELTKGKLDDEAQKAANLLIRRSTQMNNHLNIDTATDGYLNMSIKNKLIRNDASLNEYVDGQVEPVEYDGVYASADEHDKEELKKDDDNVSCMSNECPYRNKSLCEIIPQKCGHLNRKEQMLHIISVQRSYFVVLFDEWLMFYYHNKRGKALESYSLKLCEAKDADDRNSTFEIVMSDKSFTMTADTRKEKLQWISAINDGVDRSEGIKNGDETDEQIIDISNEEINQIRNTSVNEDDLDDCPIYEEIPEVLKKAGQKFNSSILNQLENRVLPTLPPIVPIKKPTLVINTPVTTLEDYDYLQIKPETQQENCQPINNEIVVNQEQEITGQNNNAADDIYDYLRSPVEQQFETYDFVRSDTPAQATMPPPLPDDNVYDFVQTRTQITVQGGDNRNDPVPVPHLRTKLKPRVSNVGSGDKGKANETIKSKSNIQSQSNTKSRKSTFSFRGKKQ